MAIQSQDAREVRSLVEIITIIIIIFNDSENKQKMQWTFYELS